MLRLRRGKLLCAVILVGFFVVFKGLGPEGFFRSFSRGYSASRAEGNEARVESGVVEIDRSNKDKRFVRYTDGTIHWMAALEKSRRLHQGESARVDLEIVEQLLGDYRLVYRENPVGVDNFEITEALMGGNSKRVFFLDPALSVVNAKGELLDRWGSPFRFHAMSGDRMNVRSLGQDKILWSEDDEVLYEEE